MAAFQVRQSRTADLTNKASRKHRLATSSRLLQAVIKLTLVAIFFPTMAPINIPGRVTQGPTLVITGASADTPVTIHIPFIFWIMILLIALLIISLLGLVVSGFLKPSTLFHRLVAYFNAIKGIQSPKNVVQNLKLDIGSVRVLKWNTKKETPVLPTSLDPQSSRWVTHPPVSTQSRDMIGLVLQPCRAFGYNVRERVHDIQEDLLQRYYVQSEEKNNQVRSLPQCTVL
jgi:hypothetical protein